MAKRIEELNFYELLEVSPNATSQEIHRAYERVRKIYDPNSIALYSLFTPEETSAIYQRIEEAYRTLLYENNRKKYNAELRNTGQVIEEPRSGQRTSTLYQAHKAQPSLPLHTENRSKNDIGQQQPASSNEKPIQKDVSLASPFIVEFTGPVMKALREQRNLSVKNIADITKIGSRYLELIEEENFAKLPARPYLRGFIILYAKALGCDPERVVNNYIKRYDAAMVKPK